MVQEKVDAKHQSRRKKICLMLQESQGKSGMLLNSFTVLACLSFVLEWVQGEYQCACNYHPYYNVYGSQSTSSFPIGYLYRSDCKPLVQQANLKNGWLAIVVFQQVAYIRTDGLIHKEVCPGDPDFNDKLKTSVQPTQFMTSSVKPTRTDNSLQSITPPTVQNITTISPSVYFSSTTSTNQHVTSGDTSLCPQSIQQLAQSGHGGLTQYKDHCLQLILTQVIWEEAEWQCRSRKGHLAEIDDWTENKFITEFLNRHTFFPVWIGLHDTVNEEQFQWISDPARPLTFTNWAPNHRTWHHDEEDCVVIGPDGQWDDKRCGHYATVDNLALKYGYICQYDIVPSTNMVPVG